MYGTNPSCYHIESRGKGFRFLGYSRSPNTAYWWHNGVPPLEPPPPPFPFFYTTIISRRYVYRRPDVRHTQFFGTNSNDFDPLRGFIEEVSEELRKSLGGEQPYRAPGYLRAENSQYWLPNLLPTPEELFSGDKPFTLGHQPDRAPGYRRSTPDQYWRDNLLSTPEALPDDRPRGFGGVYDRAPGYRRAVEDAYWFSVIPKFEHQNPPPIVSQVYGYKRAAYSAYLIVSPSPEFVDDKPKGTILLPDNTYRYDLRSRNEAYELSMSEVSGQESQVYTEALYGYISQPAQGYYTRLATNYLIVAAMPEDAPIVLFDDRIHLLISQPQNPTQRAANEAYWFNNELSHRPDDTPQGYILLPSIDHTNMRTSSEAYWFNGASLAEIIIPPPGVSFAKENIHANNRRLMWLGRF